MRYSAGELAQIVDGRIIGNSELIIEHVCYDTRNINHAVNSIFIAIKTELNDGHAYLTEAYDKGIRVFLVLKNTLQIATDATYIIVDNTIDSLQLWAAHHRKKFTFPVIAIIGSNGKTIVKEWLNYLLKKDFQISRSPRSFNSQIGVALSLLQLGSEHNLALIETGISKPGEMQKLHQMVLPNMVIFTGIGEAHSEGFSSMQQKINEKLYMCKNADVVVFPKSNSQVIDTFHKIQESLQKNITWSATEKATFSDIKVTKEKFSTQITCIHRTTPITFSIPFTDDGSIENALTCLCSIYALERLDDTHLQNFAYLPKIENRIEFIEGINQNFIINDSYSNDPESLKVTLDFADRQSPEVKKTLILSEFEQINHSQEFILHLFKMLATRNYANYIFIGKYWLKYLADLQNNLPNHIVFSNTDELLQSKILLNSEKESFIIKGARNFHFEKLVDLLQKQSHETELEIDLDALKFNFQFFKSKLKQGVKSMCMVKAFGYGSGHFEAARLLQHIGADYFCVAYTEEGIALRNAKISKPIMVLNCNKIHLSDLLQYNLEPVIYSFQQLTEFISLLTHKANLKIHIEFDTGMHRLGFLPEEAEQLISYLSHEKLELASIFSHLAASENTEKNSFTLQQINQFNSIVKLFQKHIAYPFLSHIANTGGILNFEQSQFDMVRIGIGLYGIQPAGTSQFLKPVTSLKTKISQIKEIEAGDSIGYGRNFKLNKNTTIGILPIGYADGIPRRLGNGVGTVWIHGKEAPFVGNICMDMSMVDITGIPCYVGQYVELFGKNKPVETVAHAADTIAYEILTGINQRVKRVYIGEV